MDERSPHPLDAEAVRQLVSIARHSLEEFVLRHEWYQPPIEDVLPPLRQTGSTFVTLRNGGRLRGCIGSTNRAYSLAVDTARNAAAAARDPRFPPVMADEAAAVTIEVTVLAPPRLLQYENISDLCNKLHPGRDGVILTWRDRRALLLPQVWYRFSEPTEFLRALCYKAGIPEHELHATPPLVGVAVFEAQNYKEDEPATI